MSGVHYSQGHEPTDQNQNPVLMFDNDRGFYTQANTEMQLSAGQHYLPQMQFQNGHYHDSEMQLESETYYNQDMQVDNEHYYNREMQLENGDYYIPETESDEGDYYDLRSNRDTDRRINRASPLGTLGNLPAEIRSMIFQECIHNRDGAIGLLQTSSALYNELGPLLREEFDLTFDIDPTAKSSVVDILNQNGDVVDATSVHRDTILDDMPIDKFRKIKINVHAPDPKDPGQLVRAWYQSTRLMNALLPGWVNPEKLPTDADQHIIIPTTRDSTALPQIDIDFRETPSRRWTHGSRFERYWNHSVPSYQNWDPETHKAAQTNRGPLCDFEILLYAFSSIRNSSKVRVRVPDYTGPEPRREERVARRLATLGRSPVPFGMSPSINRTEDDNTVLLRQNCHHVWLEYLLDDLEGPTAAMLRRERFQNWCPEYEYFMARAFQGYPLDNIKDSDNDDNDDDDGWKSWMTLGLPSTEMGNDMVNHLMLHCHVRFAAGRRLGRGQWRMVKSGLYIATYLPKTDNDTDTDTDNNTDNDTDNDTDKTNAKIDKWELHHPNGIKRLSENPSWPISLMQDPAITRWMHPLSRGMRTWSHVVGAVGTKYCSTHMRGFSVRPGERRLKYHIDTFLQGMPVPEGLFATEDFMEDQVVDFVSDDEDEDSEDYGDDE